MSKMIFELMAHLRIPCTYIALTLTLSPVDQNKILHDPHHLGIPSGVSKTIYEPMVCSAQTVQLPCIKINTIFKRTETSFYLSLITNTICFIQNDSWAYGMFGAKPCTYLTLTLTLTLSPNGPKQDLT
jgi:hypothetical protein